MEKVPTGFVATGSPEHGKDFEISVAELEQQYEKLPCTLYTDRCGDCYFVLKVNGVDYVLAVRTD